jgi:malic enzyme
MIQDGANSISTEMTLQASACLAEILKQDASQPVKVSYLIRALDNLRKGESVAQSVILAQNIISEYPSSAQIGDEATLTQEVILEVLEKQLGLIGRVI